MPATLSPPSKRALPTLALALTALSLPIASFACGGGSKDANVPAASASSAPSSSFATAQPSQTVGGPPDFVDAALAQLASRAAPGWSPETPVAKVMLAAGAHAQNPIQLSAGKCYVVLAVGPQGSDVDLVLSSNGQPIAQDGESDATATIGTGAMPLCPAMPTPLALDVSMKKGSGTVGLQLYAKAAPGPVATGSAATTGSATAPAVDPLDALLQSESKKLAKGMDPEGAPTKGTIQEGGKLESVVTLQPGRCYAIVAVSPTGAVSDFDMVILMAPFFTMQGGKNQRTGNVALIGGAASPLCPAAIFPIPYRIDVTAKKGSGPAAVQVLSRAK